MSEFRRPPIKWVSKLERTQIRPTYRIPTDADCVRICRAVAEQRRDAQEAPKK